MGLIFRKCCPWTTGFPWSPQNRSYAHKIGVINVQRYFIPTEQFQAHQCRITGQDAHHISRVMRFSSGDRLICCDGRGRSMIAEIEQISTEQVTCTLLEPLASTRELPV